MPKHVFFELSNLVRDRSVLDPAHQPLFKKMCDAIDVVVVSEATAAQMRSYIPQSSDASFFTLAQNGNEALNKSGEVLWTESFSAEQTAMILKLIERMKKEIDATPTDPNDLVSQRGSALSYCFIGLHENLDKKFAFDEKGALTKRMLTSYAHEIVGLSTMGVHTSPAICGFEFTLRGKKRGDNMLRLVKYEAWRKDESLYVGKGEFAGTVDESVIGIIPSLSLEDVDATFAWIRSKEAPPSPAP